MDINTRDEELMAMDTLIYFYELEDIIKRSNHDPTIGEVVEKCRDKLYEEDKEEYGAQGTKEQWEVLFDKIEDNDKLCNYVVPKEYYEIDSTGFNSMFVVDPNSKPNQNDAAIFRGTQGAYQWQDNFIVSDGVPISPHQFRARDYVLRLAQDGYRNFDASGHSKGGNMAEAAMYMTRGLIKYAVSLSGQKQSGDFNKVVGDTGWANISYYAELRDLVPKIFLWDQHMNYFKAPDLYDNLFLYHIPLLYFLDETKMAADGKMTGTEFLGGILDALVGGNTNFIDAFGFISGEKFNTYGLGKLAAGALAGEVAWSKEYHIKVIQAGKIYMDMFNSRQKKLLMAKLKMMSDLKIGLGWTYDDSEVVGGAIIMCDFGDSIGELNLAVSHGRDTRGKPVLGMSDSMSGSNISFEDQLCFGSTLDSMLSLQPEATDQPDLEDPEPCIPETDGNEWIITADDKTLNDESMNAVLQQSLLICNKGGIISIVANGQM